MKIYLAAIALAFAGCASTAVYENGKPVLRIQADALNVTLATLGGTKFHADKITHSVPTRAIGANIGTATAGATAILGAAVAK